MTTEQGHVQGILQVELLVLGMTVDVPKFSDETSARFPEIAIDDTTCIKRNSTEGL
jgi:hypothetical protein